MRQGAGGRTDGPLSFLESRVFIPRNRILVRRRISTWDILRRTFHELACCCSQRALGGFFDHRRHRLRLRYIG
jgi:hypothetical protein